MPGPPPKDPSVRRRRNAGPQLTKLPAAGRAGDPPRWPLGRGLKAELLLWGELWSTPQATQWDEGPGGARVVARYCRLVLKAERPDATASLLTEVRQLEDRLGLTPMAMLRLRWQVVDDQDDTRQQPVPSTSARATGTDGLGASVHQLYPAVD